MKGLVSLTLLVVLVVVGMGIPSYTAQAQSGMTACEVMNHSFWDGGLWTTAFWTPGLGPYQFYAGDTVYIQAGEPAEYEVMPATFLYEFNGVTVATQTYPGTLVYVVPADVMADNFLIELEDSGAEATWEVWCVPAAEDEEVVTVPVPGCDLAMTIPSIAVVGVFVADVPTYYAPGNMTSPVVTITADQTAWVLGRDASGAYYKIVWVCQYLWVPVSSMGPNPDAVWNSTLLPTGVVD